MASSRVMASSLDLTRQSSLFSLALMELQSSASGDLNRNLGSTSMDEILRNIYGENPATCGGRESEAGGGGGEEEMSVPRQESFSLAKGSGSKIMDDLWKDVPGGSQKMAVTEGSANKTEGYVAVTLEDFLARAREIREEEVRGTTGAVPQQADGSIMEYAVDSVLGDEFGQQQQQPPHQVEGSFTGFEIGGEGAGVGAGIGRGKRRAVQVPVDKVAQQRQRRMIKNRESAARSRERKQAYTVELESLVTQLEEENAELVRLQEEHNKKRLKQLMENLIPVVEGKRPPRLLRRTRSISW